MKSFKALYKKVIKESVSIGPWTVTGAGSAQVDIENQQEKERYAYSVYYLLQQAGRVSGPRIVNEDWELYTITPEIPYVPNQEFTLSRAQQVNVGMALRKYMSDDYRWILSFYTTDESQITWKTQVTGHTIDVKQPRINAIMIIEKSVLAKVLQEAPGFDKVIAALKPGAGRGRGPQRQQINFNQAVFGNRKRFIKQFINDGSASGIRVSNIWLDELQSTEFWGRIILALGLIGKAVHSFLKMGMKN